jgi:hypothetical protein
MKNTSFLGAYYRHPKLPVFYHMGMILFSAAVAMIIAPLIIGFTDYLSGRSGNGFFLRSSTMLMFMGIAGGTLLILPSVLLTRLAANPEIFYAEESWKKAGYIVSVWTGFLLFGTGAVLMLREQLKSDGYAVQVGLVTQHFLTHSWILGITFLISVSCFLVILKYKKMLPEEE